MKKILILLCGLFLVSSCSTMKANERTTKDLSKTAGMVTAMYLKQDKAKAILSTSCAIHMAISENTDPELAQENLKEDIAKIWDEAYSQGVYSVCTILNGLVTYMQLQTSEPTQESIELWKQCMTNFCSGVNSVWEKDGQKESAIHRFLSGYANLGFHASTKICALIANGQ